jgi:hypothetical protein
MGRYDTALGLDETKGVKVDVSVGGVTQWLASKGPAVLGGHAGQWVVEWALKRWPNHPRGAAFVGGVAVLVAGFGLEVLVAKSSPSNGRLFDKITDGMVGRAAPLITNTVKRILGMEVPKAAQGTASLDGDQEAVAEVARLLRDSPETTQDLATQMFELMKRDGVDIDEAGRQAVVRSMREVSSKLAAG